MQRLIKTICFWLALSLLSFAADFNFVSFDVPGARLTRPFGVNARGQIVGLYRDANNKGHGFLLDGGTYYPIDVPGATFTNASGINGRGDIVGRWTDAGNKNHSYLLTGLPANPSFTSFDPTAPCAVTALQTVAHGINDVGDIVGRCFDPDGNEYGFVRQHLDGTFTIIAYPGAVTTDAWMISDGDVTSTAPPRPVIVGDYSDSSGFVHGYSWTPAAGFLTFDFPDNQTGLRGINERGEITGIYGAEVGPFHGFLLADGRFTTVDYPGSTSNGGTLVINNSGLFVGGYIDSNGIEHGFVATECPPSGCP